MNHHHFALATGFGNPLSFVPVDPDRERWGRSGSAGGLAFNPVGAVTVKAVRRKGANSGLIGVHRNR